MMPIFLLQEDKEPMATELTYLSNDESEYSTPNATPDHNYESIYPDSINQLITSQLEQKSDMGTATVFHPTTPNRSMTSDDEAEENFTPLIGTPELCTLHIPQRQNNTIQLRQHLQPVPKTPDSTTPEDQVQRDIFRPYDVPNSSTAASHDNLPNIFTVAHGFRNLTLHPHPQRNEWVTGSSVCGKSKDQIIKETGPDYLNQIARPGETVRDEQIERNTFIDAIQS